MSHIDHAIVDVLIVDESGRFLIVQEGKPGREGLYNLPGGHVEVQETLFDAAVREAKEETGYDIELTGLVGIYQGVYQGMNFAGPVFSARVVGGDSVTSPEHPEIRWVTGSELHELADAGKLFSKYLPFAVDHYVSRGTFPLDIVTSRDYTHQDS